MARERFIVYIDKTVVKIVGLKVKNVNLTNLEKELMLILKRPVRVIGVAGDKLEFDVYDLSPEQIYRNERNIMEAIALSEGIKGYEVAHIDKAEHVPEVSLSELMLIPDKEEMCPSERWIRRQLNNNKKDK